MALEDVLVRSLTADRLESVIGPERAARFEATAEAARLLLADRTVLNVNSTATGGGVAELLQTLLAYARGAGIDTRWVVIEGDAEFFDITKRIHNHLYGSAGDGGSLGAAEHQKYEATLDRNAAALVAKVEPGDIVVLHDPQTIGLARQVGAAGAHVVWRCHVGIDTANERSEAGWDFLRPYLADVSAFVFSCQQFAPAWLPRDRLSVIPPSIDPFSAKNELMSERDVMEALYFTGCLEGSRNPPLATFSRRDGSRGQITHTVDAHGTGPIPGPDVPLVMQASRWDSMKDMQGVMVGFAEHLDTMGDAHLLLVGPSVEGVADDPEAGQVLSDCRSIWNGLRREARDRIHLSCVPMIDPDEAAAIVNALQRHATVVVQKSLAEGFGLTVAEAMWKSRPVVGSAVGGIVDQIVPGETGWLVQDPLDLDEYASAVARLLADPEDAARMGRNGQERALELFLGDRHLEQWADVFTTLVG